MTVVRVASAAPRPGRLPEGGAAIDHFLVLLADNAAGRVLPIWLTGPDGESLWRLLERPDEAGPPGVAEEATGRLLDAAGATVTGVDLGDLAPGVTTGPAAATLARIELSTPGGTRYFTARLGFGLALAVAAGAPVRVAGPVLDRLAVPADPGDLPRSFAEHEPGPSPARPSPQLRFEPRNLDFADGLERWGFGGSFRRKADEPHAEDYSCAVAGGTASVFSAVPEPYGYAGLRQTVFADDYRGQTVVFRGEIRIGNVGGGAGLRLAAGPRGHPEIAAVSGSAGWAWHKVTAHVPGHARFVTFGIFLERTGRIELRHPELTRRA